MEMRCCTPPTMNSGDEMLSSCRHLCFVNEEEEESDDHHNAGEAPMLDKSITMRPSGSFPRPSDSRVSGASRPSDDLPNNIQLPSPTREPRSPRRAFKPIPLNLPAEHCYGRTSFQGWPTDAAHGAIASTPWRPPTTHSGVVGAAGGGGMSYLQTPEVQRVTADARTSTAMTHLLYTPQIPQVCLAWRSNLDGELDAINAQHPADQLPAVTTVLDNMLYLGGFPDAYTVPQLQSLGVRHIVNCCAQDVVTCPEVAAAFHVYDLHAFDMDDYLILHHDYDHFASLVSTLLAQGEKVFVHCIAGVNRSVTLCAAYLMDRCSLTPVEAVQVLRQNGRMRLLDNRSFRTQLIDHYLQSVEPRAAEQGLFLIS